MLWINAIIYLSSIIGMTPIQTDQGPGEEFMLDTAIVYCPTECDQWPTGVSFDGTNYFVVWWSLLGARISTSGTLLDTTPITISDSFGIYPDIAFDGNNYLVVWLGGIPRNTLYAARVSVEGIVIDTDPIKISEVHPLYTRGFPRVEFDGDNYLIVWQEWHPDDQWDICGIRVSPTGVVLDSSEFVIYSDIGNQEKPTVKFNSATYLVVWNSANGVSEVEGSRIFPDGTILDTLPILNLPTSFWWPRHPALTSNGTEWLIVWEALGADTSIDLFATRVDSNGSILNTPYISISSGPYHQNSPAAGFNGTNYLIAWSNPRPGGSDVYFSRMGMDGSLLDPEGIPVSTQGHCYQDAIFVSSDSNDYLVVWSDNRFGSPDIYCARISGDGELLDTIPIPITISVNNQRRPKIVGGESRYLVLWQDFRRTSGGDQSRTADTYGLLLAPEGTSLSESFPIAASSYGPSTPDADWDGSNFLVVWETYRNGTYDIDIYGTRVTPDGTVLDSSAIPISVDVSDQRSPSVSFNGDNYLVAWALYGDSHGIDAIRISTDGILLDPEPISICTTFASQPKVASDGENYLAVWREVHSWWPLSYRIRGVLIDTAGQLLDTEPFLIQTNAGGIDVCYGSSNYFVVWSKDKNIYGARVSREGIVLDSVWIPISTRPKREYSPAVAFDGNDFVVTWQIERSDYDIQGALIDPSGQVVDEFPVSTSPYDQIYPSVASVQDNYTIVYQSYIGRPFAAYRICGVSSTGMVEPELPSAIFFFRNFPNPARRYANIAYAVNRSCHVQLKIFDIIGRVSSVLVDKWQTPGYYEVYWDGRDENGNRLPTGLYFYRLEVENEVLTRKQVLIH